MHHTFVTVKMHNNQKERNKRRVGRPSLLNGVHNFFILYFERSNIHGFSYFSLKYLQIVEKLFWLALVVVSFTVTVILSLESLERYETKSTVLSVERDHYYWNTTLPSISICPVVQRIDKKLFNEYCDRKKITGTDKEEFYAFIESMANATYESFHLINASKCIERLNIKPEDYMMLIYNLTQDQLRGDGDERVKAIRNQEFIDCEQILTEHGICYISNSIVARKLSAKYLLTGEHPKPLESLDFYEGKILNNVIGGNLFDGDKSYGMVGFLSEIMIYIHSPFDVLNIAKLKYYALVSQEFVVSANEVLTDENFQRDTRVSQRKCRFNSETNLTHYPIYTRGLCLQECRLELVYKLCGCIPHFYPNRIARPKRVCHYEELKGCVAENTFYFLELRKESANGEMVSVHCNCLQNCVDSNIYINYHRALEDTSELLGSIGGIIVIREYPLVRYKRKILFSLTDLFVSIGGTASFFTGFCVLGLIEIMYFLTIRLFWHIAGKKITSIEN